MRAGKIKPLQTVIPTKSLTYNPEPRTIDPKSLKARFAEVSVVESIQEAVAVLQLGLEHFGVVNRV